MSIQSIKLLGRFSSHAAMAMALRELADQLDGNVSRWSLSGVECEAKYDQCDGVARVWFPKNIAVEVFDGPFGRESLRPSEVIGAPTKPRRRKGAKRG